MPPSPRLPYTQAFLALDAEGVLESFTEDVQVRSPHFDGPIPEGAPEVLMRGLSKVYDGPPELIAELIDTDRAVLIFEGQVNGTALQGVHVLDLAEDGRVRSLTAFIRPLAALEEMVRAIAPLMAAEFGAPPQEPRD